MAIIIGQAAVGNRSHFNEDDGLGAMLFSIMGATIVVLWLATLAIALRFLREPGRDRVTARPSSWAWWSRSSGCSKGSR
jgi:hypothetical protein